MGFAKKKSATPTPATPDGDARADWRAAKKAQLEAKLAGVKKPGSAAKDEGPLHEGTVTRGDGKVVKVTVPRDEPKSDAAVAAAAKEEKKAGKAKARAGKAPKSAKPAKAPKAKKVSCLDAAAQILAGSDKPMKAKELIEAMATKGLWKSPSGRTPESSLYAAIIREVAAKGGKARFAKAGKGLFAAGKGA